MVTSWSQFDALGRFTVPEAIQFPQPARRRLERRRIINDTSIRSIKPPDTGAVDYFDDLTPGLPSASPPTTSGPGRFSIGTRTPVRSGWRSAAILRSSSLTRASWRETLGAASPTVPIRRLRSAPREKPSRSVRWQRSTSTTTRSRTRRVGRRTSVSSTPICCRNGRRVQRSTLVPTTSCRF
jgi:hypothetical protein